MKFIDPMPLTCDRCGAACSCRTADLFALRACCGTCGSDFDDVGRGMRRAADEHDLFVLRVELAVSLEDATGLTLADDDFLDANTPADLVDVVCRLDEAWCRTDVERLTRDAIVDVRRRRGRPAAFAVGELLNRPILEACGWEDWDRR